MMYKCLFCNKELKNKNALAQHTLRCKLNPNYKVLGGRKKGYKKPKNATWTTANRAQIFCCSFCKSSFNTTLTGFKLHEKRCKSNPKREIVCISDETKLKISNTLKGRFGGYRMTPNSTRSHRGHYKGLYCMSTWELAWVAYQLEHGNKVEQCIEKFPYIMNEKTHFYTPDFKIGDTYYEIKNWHRPDTDFKISQFPKDKTLILIEGKEQNKIYLDYAISTYGKDFYKVLYE